MAQQRNRDDYGYRRGSGQRGGQQRGYDEDDRRGRGDDGSSDFGTQYETSGMGRGREQWRESEDYESDWNRPGRSAQGGGYGQGGRSEFERGGYGHGGYGQAAGSARGEYGGAGDYGGRGGGRGSQGSEATRRHSSAYGGGGYGSQDTEGTWGQGGFGGYSESEMNEGYGGYGGSRDGQSSPGRMQQSGQRGMQSGQGGYGYGQTAGYGGGRGMHSSEAGGAPQRRGGRGPKGYKRSDERIKEEVCERLWSMDIDASEVSLEVNDGKVKLEGTVPERWMKHSIEDVADECWGVQEVDNRIRVQSGSSQGESGSQTSSSNTQASGSTSNARNKP